MSVRDFVFTKMPQTIRRRADLSGDAKVLLSYLIERERYFASIGGALFESKGEIARELGRSEKVVETRVRELVAAGLLVVEQRPGTTPLYRVTSQVSDPVPNGTPHQTGPSTERDPLPNVTPSRMGPPTKSDPVRNGTHPPDQTGPTPPTVSGGDPPPNGTPIKKYSDLNDRDLSEGESRATSSAPIERMLRSLETPSNRDAAIVVMISAARVHANGAPFKPINHSDHDTVSRLREWASGQTEPDVAIRAVLAAFFAAKGTGARLSWLTEEDPGRFLGQATSKRGGYRASPPREVFRDDDSELVELERREAERRALSESKGAA